MRGQVMEGAEVKTVPLTPELIDSYMDYLRAKGRVQGTIESCQRKLKRLYGDLPEAGKAVGRDTLGLWRRKLARDGYSAAAINQFMIAVNGYLEYMGAREFQVTDKLEVSDEFQPELTRGEYLRLLSAARSLGRERTYLLVKVFGNSDLPVQELGYTAGVGERVPFGGKLLFGLYRPPGVPVGGVYEGK